MNIRTLFQVKETSPAGDAALLVLRIICGAAFLFYGWPKIQNPFGWMGPDATTPGIFQALAAISEFGGGLAWIVGLLTRLASFGMACTMVVATHLMAVTMKAPFVDLTGPGASYDSPLILLGVSLVLMLVGPGRFALDRIVFGQR